MPIRFWLVLLLLLLNALTLAGPGTAVCIACIVWITLFGSSPFRISRHLLRWISLPLAIFAIAGAGAFQNTVPDALKDAWYLINPVIILIAGYLIAKEKQRKDDIFAAFVVASFLLSAVYIGKFIFNASWTLDSVENIRRVNGDVYVASFVTPLIVMLARIHRYPLGLLDRHKGFVNITVVLSCISLVLSLSRTFWLAAIIAIFVAMKISPAKKVLIAILLVGVLVSFSLTTTQTTGARGGGITDKIAGSAQELAIRNYDDISDINANWRGYETFMALTTFINGTPANWLFGFGMGKLVDIGFVMFLNEDGIRYIPIFHNGYAYLLIKSGIAGTTLYLIFLASMIRSGGKLRRSASASTAFYGQFLVILSLVLGVTTFVVAGFYSKFLTLPIIFLLGMCLSQLAPAATTAPARRSSKIPDWRKPALPRIQDARA
jgi:O-Antigen ligase